MTTAERYCLFCNKDGHLTHECLSTHGLNTPAARELARLAGAFDARTERETAMEELLHSACAIAERKGTGTAWERFEASISALDIGSVTARTYRILPSDTEADAPLSQEKEASTRLARAALGLPPEDAS